MRLNRPRGYRMKVLTALRRAVFSMAFVKVLLFAALMVGVWLVARRYDFSVPAMRESIEARGPLTGAAVLFGLYVLTSVAPISARDVLKVLGVLFLGPLVSALAIWMADIVAAVLSYQVAKWLGKEAVDRLFGRRMAWVNRRLEEHGFRNMVILRLAPTPYRHLNFLSGVTTISFADFFWGTTLGAGVRAFAMQFALWPFVDVLIRDESTGTTLLWIAMGGLAMMAVLLYGSYAIARRRFPAFFRADDQPAESPLRSPVKRPPDRLDGAGPDRRGRRRRGRGVPFEVRARGQHNQPAKPVGAAHVLVRRDDKPRARGDRALDELVVRPILLDNVDRLDRLADDRVGKRLDRRKQRVQDPARARRLGKDVPVLVDHRRRDAQDDLAGAPQIDQPRGRVAFAPRRAEEDVGVQHQAGEPGGGVCGSGGKKRHEAAIVRGSR